uniref:Protein TEX261 n=1 Tax=Lutzomyia longipalpis TaxID=7200 RepID=A0A7G3AS90_LUTLO
MGFLYILSYISLLLQIIFATISIAAGLYYVAELVEEYTVIAKKIILMMIFSTAVIHIFLVIFDSFPWLMILCGLLAQGVHALIMKNFPYVQFLSFSFLGSVILLIINNYLAFTYFASHYYMLSEVIAYFTICLWLVPFALFVSLSANDNVLPTVNERSHLLNLAATAMGLPFNTETGIKICGTRKSIYMNYRRIIQKLIGTTKIIGIPELCLQMGLPSGVQEAATEKLPKYLEYMTKIKQTVDREHPQYAGIVLYQIAKQRKVKVSRMRFTQACNLRSEQWKILEDSWEKYEKNSKANELPRAKENTTEDVEMKCEGKKEASTGLESEDYEVWKERILARAYENLRRK